MYLFVVKRALEARWVWAVLLQNNNILLAIENHHLAATKILSINRRSVSAWQSSVNTVWRNELIRQPRVKSLVEDVVCQNGQTAKTASLDTLEVEQIRHIGHDTSIFQGFPCSCNLWKFAVRYKSYSVLSQLLTFTYCSFLHPLPSCLFVILKANKW